MSSATIITTINNNNIIIIIMIRFGPPHYSVPIYVRCVLVSAGRGGYFSYWYPMRQPILCPYAMLVDAHWSEEKESGGIGTRK